MAIPKQYTRISGVWKLTRKAYVRVGGTWKLITFGWQKLVGTWTRIGTYHQIIPAGGIVLFVGTVVPAGWTRLSGADNRMIVGAGSTYSVGATGGTDTSAFSGNTDTKGNHTGTNFDQRNTAHTAGDNYSGTVSRGSHSHTYDVGTQNVVDIYKNYILIQADADTLLPADAVVLSASTLVEGDLTNTEIGVTRFARGSSSYGSTGGNDSNSSAITSSNAGSHRHGIYSAYTSPCYSYNDLWDNNIAGDHSHTVTVAWDLSTYYMGLSAWKSSVDNTNTEINSIIMFNGATAPEGYELCDGTNGTPDMRNRFLKIVDTGSQGVGGGSSSNTAAWSINTDSAGGHQHKGVLRGSDNTFQTTHSNTINAHTHATASTRDIVQSYYALTFIRRTLA